jgi:hypothetical protein
MATTAGNRLTLNPAVAAIFHFIIGTKNLNFVEDHPINIPV